MCITKKRGLVNSSTAQAGRQTSIAKARVARAVTLSMSLAHLMLSISTNPQHNEKNNHYLPGCFLHCIDRRFLCRPSLQPETHITRQHTTRRRQRRNASRLRFQRRRAGIYAVTVSMDAALTTNAQLDGRLFRSQAPFTPRATTSSPSKAKWHS